MPPSDSTATSVVPPPMSTIIDPVGSVTGSPAPIAAAIGSSIRKTRRAPALSADSWIARRSTAGDPDDRGLVEDDAAAFYINQRIGCPQVDRHVGRQQPEHFTNHCQDGPKM